MVTTCVKALLLCARILKTQAQHSLAVPFTPSYSRTPLCDRVAGLIHVPLSSAALVI